MVGLLYFDDFVKTRVLVLTFLILMLVPNLWQALTKIERNRHTHYNRYKSDLAYKNQEAPTAKQTYPV
jgi:hypothetical protein